MSIILTIRERAVLAHVVVDPDAWAEHACDTFGDGLAREYLDAKVARHQSSYGAALAAGNYKNRKQRDAEEKE